jgi:fatty-acyl-CoA synthase
MEDDGYAAPCGADADKSRVLPILGRPVPGLEIRITDPATGDVLAERMSGELEIRGTSVTTGYYKRPDETADKFHDGWLRTGDLAYMLDGQLVLCGRLKDLVIIGGRNILPQDVERAAVVNGVRPGNVIAFGVESRKGREALVVVAEVKGTEHDIIRDEIRHAVYSAVGESPEDVLLVEPGTLPKTSSGKLQRSLCRSRYLEHALAPA